ncbi:MAG: hypothetical protein AB8W78_11915 [Arsenophonus endosymbiont of Dermacentor nuttalli]
MIVLLLANVLSIILKDAKSNRIVSQLEAKYRTITYQQLSNRAESIANEWYHHCQYPQKPVMKLLSYPLFVVIILLLISPVLKLMQL